MFASNKIHPIPMVIRCMFLLLMGIILSFLLVVSVSAIHSQGHTYDFTVGSNDYSNSSKLTVSGTSVGSSANPSTNITSKDTAGSLGAVSYLYVKSSNGGWSLVASGTWYYSSNVWGLTNSTLWSYNLQKGTYISSGQSAVLYAGTYKTHWTYGTDSNSTITIF